MAHLDWTIGTLSENSPSRCFSREQISMRARKRSVRGCTRTVHSRASRQAAPFFFDSFLFFPFNSRRWRESHSFRHIPESMRLRRIQKWGDGQRARRAGRSGQWRAYPRNQDKQAGSWRIAGELAQGWPVDQYRRQSLGAIVRVAGQQSTFFLIAFQDGRGRVAVLCLLAVNYCNAAPRPGWLGRPLRFDRSAIIGIPALKVYAMLGAVLSDRWTSAVAFLEYNRLGRAQQSLVNLGLSSSCPCIFFLTAEGSGKFLV